VSTSTIVGEQDRLPDLFVTRAMLRRRRTMPDLQAEAAAFCELSKIIADDPCVALRYLLDIARGSCSAGSAGLSLLRDDDAGRTVVRWAAISGALAAHEGTDTPRDSSPCGLCLDSGTTIRVARPQRAFTSLRATEPEIVEDLIVPLYDNASKPLGTLWIAHHDRKSHFTADDARVAEQLAAQSVLALNLVERAKEQQYAMALRDSHQVAQQQLLAHDLAEERGLREHAEALVSESRRALVFKDAMLHEVNHRTKNTLQAAGSLLVLQASATSSAQVRVALLDSYARLQLLAKVHELLCMKADSAQTMLMPELLQTLADGLRQAFANTSAPVSLQLTCDPISLPVNEAIPLALLANELLTNAYKHAFPNDVTGEITMSLRDTPENGLTLRISDNGIGLYRTGSDVGLGRKLIRTLASQLRGTLIFVTPPEGAGTVVTLTIRPPAWG
jgi:two-component sensor histidine kinase